MKQSKLWNELVLAVRPRGLTSLPLVAFLVACSGEKLPLDSSIDSGGTGGTDDGAQGSDNESNDDESVSATTSETTGAESDELLVSAGGLKNLRATRFVGEANSALGSVSAIVGDMDDDGFDELVLLDYWEVATHPTTLGAAYLFYGRESFPDTVDVADADLILRGADWSATGLGDIDGDGYADLAFTSTCNGLVPECEATAGVHIIYGGPERLSGEYRSNELGLQWTLDDPGAGYLRVRSAGDVNGDSLGDMLFDVDTGLASPVDDPGTFVSYLLLGRRDREQQAPEPGSADAWFDAGSGNPLSFRSEGAGDVDSDGFDDVLISTGNSPTGRVELFYGSPDRFEGSRGPAHADASFDWSSNEKEGVYRLGDLDNDGFDDLGLGYTGSPSELRVVYGRGERFSGNYDADIVGFSLTTPMDWISGLASGDLDNDGYLDLVLGDANVDTYGVFGGAVMFIPGTPERPTGHSQLTTDQFHIFGRGWSSDPVAGPELGYGVSSGGDVNNDGYDDVLVNAPGTFSSVNEGGSVFLFLGGEFE